jgi:hypothetical protein
VSGAQKHKKDSEVLNFFTLLGTTHLKAVHRTLMKLDPGVNFINTLARLFCTKVSSAAFLWLHLALLFLVDSSTAWVNFTNILERLFCSNSMRSFFAHKLGKRQKEQCIANSVPI